LTVGQRQSTPIRALVALSFLAMVAVNALANLLPINGQTTGEVSNAYPNLFTPAGLTFGIWGIIYLLLAGFTLYYLGLFRGDHAKSRSGLLDRVGLWFIVSSVANLAWVFAWHYHAIGWSMLLMALILFSLIMINLAIRREQFSWREQLFIRLPFSVYFGWITVATIANVAVLLVSLGWDRLGIADATWTILVIIVGLLIGGITAVRLRDLAYGLVLIWAYAGILIKHLSSQGWAGQFPAVVLTVGVSIALLLALEVYLLRSRQTVFH